MIVIIDSYNEEKYAALVSKNYQLPSLKQGESMRIKLIFWLMVCGLAAGLCAVNSETFDYNKAWQQIEELRYKRLPLTLQAKVDSLYEIASKESKTDQQIKALIFQFVALQQNQEFSTQKAIDLARKRLETASYPASAIIHNLLARMYWGYYTGHRSKFSLRGETIVHDKQDIATWDLKTIVKEAIKEYSISLAKADELQNYPLKDFTAILSQNGSPDRKLRPTLYDLLAHEALEFYKNSESSLPLPQDEFKLDKALFFAPAGDFAKLELSSPDTLSMKYHALLLYRELIRFHLRDEDPEALMEVNLERLQYLYKRCSLPQPETYFENALRAEMEQYAASPVSAMAAYQLALLYKELGDKYQPGVKDEYRWHYKLATELCSEYERKYPKSYGGLSCHGFRNKLNAISISLTNEQQILPDAPFKALLEAKNISRVTVKVYSFPFQRMEDSKIDPIYQNYGFDELNNRIRKLYNKPAIWSKEYELPDDGDKRAHYLEIPLEGLPLGNYILIAGASSNNTSTLGYSLFSCTELSYISAYQDDRKLTVLNRRTGKPIKGAIVEIFCRSTEDWNSPFWLESANPTDIEGKANIEYQKTRNYGYSFKRMRITNSADTLVVFELNPVMNEPRLHKTDSAILFSDRAIYRPGQKVYLKGVLFTTDNEKQCKLRPNTRVSLNISDVNRQKLSSITTTSNEYGTFDCEFTIPRNILTGELRIEGTAYTTIKVEEYKRPRFEVSIAKPKATFKLNQEVTLEGKATTFAGFPVDNATVSYRISRQAKYPLWYWWWGPMPKLAAKEIASGVCQTDSQGKFTLNFTAWADENAVQKYSPFFSYSISAEVTDLGGDTNSGSLSLNISEQELILDPIVPETVDKSLGKLAVPLKVTNYSGEAIPTEGKLTIYSLQGPEKIYRDRLWRQPDRFYLSKEQHAELFPGELYSDEDIVANWKRLQPVWTARFDTALQKELLIRNLGKWASGAYVLEMVAESGGKQIKTEKYFTLYSSSSKTLPYPKPMWFAPVKTNCEPGDLAEILIGSSYPDVRVSYQLEKDYQILEEETFTLNNSQRLIRIPVTEDDRGGFYVHLVFVKAGRLYNIDQEISVPWSNKQISFEYLTFRDKLLPGTQEEWRLKLKDSSGGKVTAELLASMYDASLDTFAQNPWSAQFFVKPQRRFGWTDPRFVSLSPWRITQYPSLMGYIPSRNFEALNWFSYSIGWDGDDVVYFKAYSDELGAVNPNAVPAPMAKDKVGTSRSELPQAAEELATVKARSNFAETAFFHPKLYTDENGEVSFSFTVPEALTRWKFRAFALNKELQYGFTENTTVTQKPLMVQPNLPRFLREGDTINISAKISSLNDQDQEGRCQIFLFDALSGKQVDALFKLSQPSQYFQVKKGQSTSVSWVLSVPYEMGAIRCKIVAKAGDYSDGEESILPVLSNRMLVTESLPLPVRGKQMRDFSFSKLLNSGASKTIRQHRLTLEYTSNPAWYAVQALPYLMEYPHECSEQLFSRLYSNSLASHIVNSSPRIKEVFDAWSNSPDSIALLSNLEKNQELKAVLLQETPWVLDAKRESQNKKRVALLFELSKLADEYEASLTKLQKAQASSGAWAWFSGMQDSWWVTQYIVEGFGHLDKLGVDKVNKDKRVEKMLKSAIGYLDRRIVDSYNEVIRLNRLEEDNLGYLEMHYLYARSFYPQYPIPAQSLEAVNYFRGQADEFWPHKSLYGQGLIALARHRDDTTKAATEIIASLRERALQDEEQGTWWKEITGGWYWYQAPIETMALMSEVFTEIASDTLAVDGIRTWLLKNKQTTSWKTTKATTEACYALLLSGTEWLDNSQLAEITLGGTKLDPATLEGVTLEAGTGYFKTAWTGSEIKPEMGSVTVKNPNDVPSWGALYWQYFDDLDKITPAETPLKLKKQLMLERKTQRGLVLEPITETTKLKPGDKVIVHIELRSDRDMEFLHLKDMRSAGFEPINVLSGCKWQDGLCYYEATSDAATNFFIEYLRKGTYVFEYPLRVNNKGNFSNGISSIQCLYAPEFSAHSEGIRVNVEE